MNTAKNIEPRGGARPVGVRHRRPKGRGRTDAQARVTRCFAKVQDRATYCSQTAHSRRSGVRANITILT